MKNFINRNGEFYINNFDTFKELKCGKVYELKFNYRLEEFYLCEFKDDLFKLPEKIYNLETKFIDKVLNVYNKSSKGFGIFLYGEQGSGKTITMKRICNDLGKTHPIIICYDYIEYSFIPFLSKLEQDFIFVIDEYEKLYNHRAEFLNILDGIGSPNCKMLSIFIANTLEVNKYLFNRPSRIRYMKLFQTLPINVIEELIDDKLQHTKYKKELLDICIKNINNMTIDIISELINEINILNIEPQMALIDFNIVKIDELLESQSNILTENITDKLSKEKISLEKHALLQPKN